MHIRPATPGDLPALLRVIERAYRGDSARMGWTHEADLLDDRRIGMDQLAAVLENAAERLLVALSDEDSPIGCVQVSNRGGGLAYLGLLCIEPLAQAAGHGRRLIAAAEALAAEHFAASAIEMTVIDSRAELIAYYRRRGYAATGEVRPFPVPRDPPLWMVVLARPLGA